VCVCDNIATICLSVCLSFRSKRLQCMCVCVITEQEKDEEQYVVVDDNDDVAEQVIVIKC